MKPAPELHLIFAHPGWRRMKNLRAHLQKAVAVTHAHLPARMQFPMAFTLLLTDNVVMRRLNRDFRGINRPTNVLSFPQFAPRELPKKGKTGSAVMLGDIALGYQYIVCESNKSYKILINHVTHLVIHGLLHLLGYDHPSDKKAARMERLETRILAALGLPNPYRAVQPTEPRTAGAAGKKRRTAARPQA